MASSNYAGEVRISEEFKEGGFFVLKSEDLSGFLLCGKDIKKLRADIPNAIKLLFKMNYEMDVEVRLLTDPAMLSKCESIPDICDTGRWTAIPVNHAHC